MSESMIERVAAALIREMETPTMAEDQITSMARAAIEEMRNAPIAILAAMQLAQSEGDGDWAGSFRRMWDAGIDAALQADQREAAPK